MRSNYAKSILCHIILIANKTYIYGGSEKVEVGSSNLEKAPMSILPTPCTQTGPCSLSCSRSFCALVGSYHKNLSWLTSK